MTGPAEKPPYEQVANAPLPAVDEDGHYRYRPGWTYEPSLCDHPAGPMDYDQVVAMKKTHKQRKCPGCGLYKVWVPK